MPDSSSQAFLRKLVKKLWPVAGKLRSNLDAAVYKHAVLGLILLKYVSDSFAERQAEVEKQLRDRRAISIWILRITNFHLDPADYKSPGKYEEAIHAIDQHRIAV